MYDILMILVVFLWKISMNLADFCNPNPFLDPFHETDPDPADRNETDPDPQHCFFYMHENLSHFWAVFCLCNQLNQQSNYTLWHFPVASYHSHVKCIFSVDITGDARFRSESQNCETHRVVKTLVAVIPLNSSRQTKMWLCKKTTNKFLTGLGSDCLAPKPGVNSHTVGNSSFTAKKWHVIFCISENEWRSLTWTNAYNDPRWFAR